MHLPLAIVPGPIDAGAASRNRGARRRALWLLVPVLAGACAGPPEPQAGGNETVVRADDGVWERLPVGARVRLDGVLSGEFDNGSYALSSFPLDWQVRQLLRPKRGVPVIA